MPGGPLDRWLGRSSASHFWAFVLVVVLPLVAGLLPLALHGFPAHGACYEEGPSEALLDALARDGRVCGAVAGFVFLTAAIFWWDSFDDPPPGRGGGAVLVLATVGALVLVGICVLFSLLGGRMDVSVTLAVAAAAAVVGGEGAAPRTFALLCVAGAIVCAVIATGTWGGVLAC